MNGYDENGQINFSAADDMSDWYISKNVFHPGGSYCGMCGNDMYACGDGPTLYRHSIPNQEICPRCRDSAPAQVLWALKLLIMGGSLPERPAAAIAAPPAEPVPEPAPSIWARILARIKNLI